MCSPSSTRSSEPGPACGSARSRRVSRVVGRAVGARFAPAGQQPAEAHRSGKPVVWLQANIHAGEVEGKEAAQMLLRDLTLGPLRPLLDNSSSWSSRSTTPTATNAGRPGEQNRPGQNGPAPVGQNQNGQGLNLNRDYVKMEAPETRGGRADRSRPGIPMCSSTCTPPTAAITATP